MAKWQEVFSCHLDLDEGAFSFVHLIYKYTTTDTTVYIHLTKVISVATSLCKIACFHIKSPSILSLVNLTFWDNTMSRNKALRLVLLIYVVFQGQWQKYSPMYNLYDEILGMMVRRKVFDFHTETFAAKYKFIRTVTASSEPKKQKGTKNSTSTNRA